MTDDEAVQWLTDDEIAAFTPSFRKHLVEIATLRRQLSLIVEPHRNPPTQDEILHAEDYVCGHHTGPTRRRFEPCFRNTDEPRVCGARIWQSAGARRKDDARFMLKAFRERRTDPGA